jgi:hypothetical protein
LLFPSPALRERRYRQYAAQSNINSGNIWWYGTLLTARTVLPTDTLVVQAGALIITLA